MKTLGLLGEKLGYSFSKPFFDAKFKTLGLTQIEYLNFEIQKIDLMPIISKQYDLIGLNITMPYKNQVVQFTNNILGIANDLQCVNTLVFSNNNCIGYNTDIPAFLETLKPYKLNLKPIIILGTGAMAKALQTALQITLHKKIYLVGQQKGDFTYQNLTDDVIKDAQMLINTTPLGTFPEINSAPNINYDALQEHQILYDLVYNPKTTHFLQKGLKKKCHIINGLEMLYLQAEMSFKIWQKYHIIY